MFVPLCAVSSHDTATSRGGGARAEGAGLGGGGGGRRGGSPGHRTGVAWQRRGARAVGHWPEKHAERDRGTSLWVFDN